MKYRFVPKTLLQKIIYTAIILAIYAVGRGLPIYGVDRMAIIGSKATNNLLLQTIGGDQYQCSLLALGISPYMFSNMIVQMFNSLKNGDGKQKTSPKTLAKYTLNLMLLWASVQAIFQIQRTPFLFEGDQLMYAKLIAGAQLVTGSFVILWLSTRNAKYGIGGQTILIFANILDSVVNVFRGKDFSQMKIITIIGAIAMLLTIIIENSEFRIPMQRISIHSIFSDKNYLAIKMNPIGMMPVMFSSAFFMIPMYSCMALLALFPDNEMVVFVAQQMTTDKPLGVITYIVILYALTIGFSLIFINPKSLAEQMVKSGDSIIGLKSGRSTKKYIKGVVIKVSVFSATIMSITIGLPLYFHMLGYVDKTVMSLPTILMALAGISCNLYREYIAVRDYDAYVPFL